MSGIIVEPPEEPGPSSGLSDADLAAALGIPVRAVTSARAGIPDWIAEAHLSIIAGAFGMEPAKLRANFAKVKRQVWGRSSGASPTMWKL